MRSTLRAAVLLLVIGWCVMAHAAEPFNAPQLLPPSSFCVLSISDCPQAWQRIKTTPIYREYQALLANPVLTNNIHYKEFDLKKRKWELAAGFPLSLDTIAGQMVSGMDLALVAPSSLGAPFSVIVIIEARDLAKVQKCLSILEPQPAQPDDQVSGPTPSPTPKIPMYKSVAIKTMENSTLQYALVGKHLIISNSGLYIRETIDRAKGDLKTSLTTSPDFAPLFAKALEGLKPTTHELFYVVDYGKIGKALMQMVPGMSLIAGSSLMNMAMKSCMVGSVHIETSSIACDSYMPFSTDQTDATRQLFRKYPPQSLTSQHYLPQGTLFCSASNLLDGPIVYDMYYNAFAVMGSMGGFPATNNAKTELDAKIAELETTLGFKLKDDLMASLGPEYCVAINNMTFLPAALIPIPIIDFAIVVQTKDRAKMTTIMQKLEQQIQKPFQSQAAPPGQSSSLQLGFQTTTYNGVPIRSLSLPNLPSYSPCYAFDGQFLLVETSVENMKNLLNVKANTSPGMVKNAEFQTLIQRLPEKQNQFQYIATAKVIDLIKRTAIMQFGANPPDELNLSLAVLDAITSVRVLGVSTTSDSAGTLSRGILLMK